jgi:zinc protease
MRRPLLVALLAAAASITTAARTESVALVPTPSPFAAVEAVTRYRLDNGLDVVLHEDHAAPVVAVNLWYHVGAKDEPLGKNGFAHLFEHLMFQGSKHVGEDMFFRYLERAGASQRNGTTNSDRTNYFEVVPKTQLPLALWLESDRMGTLLDHVDRATFESQREVVKNERRQSCENAPYGMVWILTHAALFPEGHPYHRAAIGTPEELDAASLDDAKSFFRRWYVPNNATLVVAGDIDPQRAKELIAKYFGPIARGADPKPAHDAMPVAPTTSTKLTIEADVELPRLMVMWPTPRAFAAGDADLDQLANVLADGEGSRLRKRLVHDLQIAQDVSAWQGSGLLASDFTIEITLRKGHTAEEALALVDAETAAIAKAPPNADEVERARTKAQSRLVFEMERISERANDMNYYAQTLDDPSFFSRDLARTAAVSAGSIQRAARDWIAKRPRVVTFVVPTKGAPRSGKLAASTQVSP